MPAAKLLKDRFFTKAFVRKARALFKKHDVTGKHVKKECEGAAFAEMSVMQRMRALAGALDKSLPEDTARALEIVWSVQKAASTKGDFEWMIAPEVVSLRGVKNLDDPHIWRLSMQRLAQLTQFSTSEMAMRPFLRARPQRTLAQVREWTLCDNPHVRRLASECIRPRLPWATRMNLPLAPILCILSMLRHDSASAVRRSVANCLGDIAKDDPELVIRVLQLWKQDAAHRKRFAVEEQELPPVNMLIGNDDELTEIDEVDFLLRDDDSDDEDHDDDDLDDDDSKESEEEKENEEDPTTKFDYLVRCKSLGLEQPHESSDYDSQIGDEAETIASHAVDSVTYIASHGVRYLVKKGHRGAFALLNANGETPVEVSDLTLSSESVRIGGSLSFTCKAKVKKQKADSEEVLFQYAIDYVKSRGTSRGVFLLKRMTLSDVKVGSKRGRSARQAFDEEFTLQARRNLRQMTTRSLYPGKHHLHILANGKVLASKSFDLRQADHVSDSDSDFDSDSD